MPGQLIALAAFALLFGTEPSVFREMCRTPTIRTGAAAPAQNDEPSQPQTAARVDRVKGTIWIPGGEFGVGSTDPLASPDERPVHPVRVRPHWMDQTELTIAKFAARGGLDGMSNVWGDEPVDPKRRKTRQGRFPAVSTCEDASNRTSPVRSLAPNGYGLLDMAGNVWEWCFDLYRPDAYARRLLEAGDLFSVIENPKGSTTLLDPLNPHLPESRFHRGGSLLCSESYCASYRPRARMAAPPDTALHLHGDPRRAVAG